MASEVAYYTYIYAKVDREKFQIVTGYAKSSVLFGKFFGAFVAQILMYFKLGTSQTLVEISVASELILHIRQMV